jgi:ferredoxin-type protein NapG
MSNGTSRREFFVHGAQLAGAAAAVGTLWFALLRAEAHAAAGALRPPGARAEADFAARCIKCGQCVRACPFATLRLASVGAAAPIGTPYFEPRRVPCYMCQDLPCTKACPSGALDAALDDIAKARMGVAVLDEQHCLSWQGMRCEVCYRVCPLRGKAIVVNTEPRRLSRHAVFEPVVDADHCTGCGMCEQACPTEQAAIRVLRAEHVQGRIGAHYRMQERARAVPPEGMPAASTAEPAPLPSAEAPAARRPADRAPGIDYLNRGGPL